MLTPEQAARVLAEVRSNVIDGPVRPEDIRHIVEIELRSGALHVEVYSGPIPSVGETGRPGVMVFILERSRRGEWRCDETGATEILPNEDLDGAIARLAEEEASVRPKPPAPVTPKPKRVRPAVSESEGMGSLADMPVIGEPSRATDADVDEAERVLGARLPAGYRTFVVELGEGVFGSKLRIYPPARVIHDLDEWRERIERYWFWGEAPLPQATALECVRIGDTIDGDELVFHPSDPDTLYLLPRHSDRSRALGRGLAEAIAKVVRAKRPALEAFPRRPPR